MVILHPVGRLPADLPALVQALESEGAAVALVACAEPYDHALEAIESADSVIVWR